MTSGHSVSKYITKTTNIWLAFKTFLHINNSLNINQLPSHISFWVTNGNDADRVTHGGSIMWCFSMWCFSISSQSHCGLTMSYDVSDLSKQGCGNVMESFQNIAENMGHKKWEPLFTPYLKEQNWWIIQPCFILTGPNFTHWGRVTHICVSKLYHHWFR